MHEIPWQTDWQEALSLAAREGRQVYLDFFLPGCIGCRYMQEGPYQDPQVIQVLNEDVVPLKMSPHAEPYAERYLTRWTPYLLILDAEERMHQSDIGFQPSDQLVPWIWLGLAKAEFFARGWARAQSWLERLLEKYPQSPSAPEAVYRVAIARYRQTEDVGHMALASERMADEYPDSPWAARVSPYFDLM